MHSTASIAVVAALAGMSVAKPVEIQGKSTFRVDQVAVPKKANLNAAQHVLKAQAKYGNLNNVDPAIKQAAAQQGSVQANNEPNDREYLCPVSIGGQTLNLDFDTGSDDLWVFSTLTPSSQSQGHTKYNPSRAQRLNGETWSIKYQDQSGSSGIVYSDKVVVGGVTATNQAVEVATQVSQQFQEDTDNDGLLGLSLGSNTCQPQRCTSFFDNVKSSLSQALFATRLRRGQPGVYDFGYIDNSLYTGSISYVNTDSSYPNYWTFQAGDLSVNGNGIGSGGLAIADTGTTLMLVPNDILNAYYGQIQSAQNSGGMWIFDCNDQIPDLQVNIGGGTFTVPGSYINWVNNGDGTCSGGLQYNQGLPFSIYGDIFLKNQYVVFDQTQGYPRLGFAQGA
ncbi:aspartic proteinase II-1 [Myriangium duriaei CBS 260.36]|uniref:Aspartic proteinase II-1 n=1 Tax=Myriangium duriaei CBS 260.36 TaxID=1168546 RepID=A0A9P4IXA0_9PEZI|nr:aspartic proteinase II-1 [Myriangium duriaei CBS 260.36]